MRPTLSTSLFTLLTGVRAIAQEIKDLSPESEARKNILHYSESDLDELNDLSSAIHFYDELAHGIINDVPLDVLNNIVVSGLNKLNTDYVRKLNNSSTFSKAQIVHRVAHIEQPGSQDFGIYQRYLIEKTTFKREIQPLPLDQSRGDYKYNKRNFVELKRKSRAVYTVRPKDNPNRNYNRETCLYRMEEGLLMLLRNTECNDLHSKPNAIRFVLLDYDLFEKELAHLLLAFTKIATEIRMYSSYSGVVATGFDKHIPNSTLKETHDLAQVILIASEILDTLQIQHLNPKGLLIDKVGELTKRLGQFCEFHPSNVFAHTHIDQRKSHSIKEVAVNSITTIYEHNFEEDLLPQMLKKWIEQTKLGMGKIECLRDTTYTINKNHTRFHLVEALIESLNGFAQKATILNVA